MLVTSQGALKAMQRRTRSMPGMKKALAPTLKQLPQVYIFNVGPRSFPNARRPIPACDAGAQYSDPVIIEPLVLGEYDLGDGAGGMGTTVDPALSGLDDEGNPTFGVAEDIIGSNGANRALDIFTTNLEWYGVFATTSNPPKQSEIDGARMKWKQMCELIYVQGAQKVTQGEPVQPSDRALYNQAAQELGRPPLWGTIEHQMDRCPECREAILAGAQFCKHCQQPIDPASVAARAKKRERELAKLEKEEEVPS